MSYPILHTGYAFRDDFIVWYSLGFFFYSLPLIIAILRDSRHQVGIMVLDVLLGWTVIGWLISFIWAFHDK